MASIALRAGPPMSSDEQRAMTYAGQMGQVKVLNPNRYSGGHKKKRKKMQPKQLRK